MTTRPGNYSQALEKYLSSPDFKDSILRNVRDDLVLVLYASGSYAVKSKTSRDSEPDDFIVLTLPTYTERDQSVGALEFSFAMQKDRIAAELREGLNR